MFQYGATRKVLHHLDVQQIPVYLFYSWYKINGFLLNNKKQEKSFVFYLDSNLLIADLILSGYGSVVGNRNNPLLFHFYPLNIFGEFHLGCDTKFKPGDVLPKNVNNGCCFSPFFT